MSKNSRISTNLRPVLRRAGQWLLLPACLLAAAALALLGEHFRAQAVSASLRTLDPARQMLFVAQADGSVRALLLRHTVSEVATLRAPQRSAVRDLALDADGRVLWVLGDDATYRYDAVRLTLLERRELSAPDRVAFARNASQLARLDTEPGPQLPRALIR